MKKIIKTDNQFFAEIAGIIKEARCKAYQAVNHVMIQSYWHIGKRIVEREQDGNERAQYGEYLIVNLSRYLTDVLGDGFSEANIRNIRQFYLKFPFFDKFATHCVANLSWTHLRLIMRLDNENERDYYLRETQEQNWSSRVLERNIKSGYYRRLISSKKTISKNLTAINQNTSDFVKDPYILEFLNVPEDLSGKETLLEAALVENLQKFLLELGKGFSFVARQQRISAENEHFYIDLVFYNYILKCFVIIDLKTQKLTHQDMGQMDMYVRMFDELKRQVGDNPTIGIILCADKSETIVKYSILNENKRIFASKYKTVLPSEKELAQMIEKSNRKLLDYKKSVQ